MGARLFPNRLCRGCDRSAVTAVNTRRVMDQSPRRSLSGLLAVAGFFTGAGAVLAASCCVLPLVLGGLGAGAGVFAFLESLADYRTALLAGSTVLVAVAWV